MRGPATRTRARLTAALGVIVLSTGAVAACTATTRSPSRGGAGPNRHAVAETLLRDRVAAIEPGDRARWLSHVEGSALRAEQEEILSRMRAIGVADVVLRSVEETLPPTVGGQAADVTWTARAQFSYRIKEFDDAARTFDLDLTFRSDAAHPDRAASMVGSRPSDRPQPWDLPDLRVRRSAGALVLAFEGGPLAGEVATRAMAAAGRVGDVLGSAGPAVWVAPATDADAAQLLGRDEAALHGLAAVVDGPIGPGQPAGSDRIVLVPSAWASLTPTGRDVVMAHELTHATTRRASQRQPPLWLSEGLAEFVAYQGLTLPERTAVAPALVRVRSEGIPAALPDDSAFDPGSGPLDVSYGFTLVAARTIADKYGVAALVALFRAAAGTSAGDAPDDADAAVDRFLVERLGTNRHELTSAWQQRLAHLVD